MMRKAKPWDLLNPKAKKVDSGIAAERLAICGDCDSYGTVLSKSQCSECKCFMPGKVRLSGAECPLGKWGRVDIPETLAVVVNGEVVQIMNGTADFKWLLMQQPKFVDGAGLKIGDMYA